MAAIIGWSAFFALILFGLLNGLGVFRVTREIEEKGLITWFKQYLYSLNTQ